MTPEEAIESLQQYEGKRGILIPHSVRDAIKLGIEALKLIKRYKETGIMGPTFKLPGETEE